MSDPEVLVWGAGIAGSRLAGLLAAAGMSVTVISRGPASYPVLPGLGLDTGQVVSRSHLESSLLAVARDNGAIVDSTLSDVTSFQTSTGQTGLQFGDERIASRWIVFADGADPRIGRSLGLLADWEPWQLVHFAWQEVATPLPGDGLRVVAGERDGLAWRGYAGTVDDVTWIGVGWNLMHEMESHVHITEMLPDALAALGGDGNLSGEPQVEVVPHEPRRVEAPLVAGNLLTIGDLAGVVQPLSLRRVELSLKIAGYASAAILRAHRGNGILDGPAFRRDLAAVLRSEASHDGGPAFPPVPRPGGQASGLRGLVRRVLDLPR